MDAAREDSSPDAPADTPVEDARDASFADRPDGPPPPPMSSYDVETHLTVFSTDPCPDWEVLPDTRPRRLPVDSTPRELWRWPSSGPSVVTEGGASVGPDGHLYLIGPTSDRAMSLTREGDVRWIGEALGEYLQPTMAIAPDGTAFVALRSSDERIDLLDLLGYSPAGEVVAGGGVPLRDGGVGGLPVSIAIGPGGMVYVAGEPGRIVATCRGRLRWRLDLTYTESGEPARAVRARVDRDGLLWVDAVTPRTFLLGAQGRMLAVIEDDTADALTLMGLGAGGEALLAAATGVWPATDTRIWGYLWEDGAWVRRFEEQTESTLHLLDPLGGVWEIVFRPPGPGEFTMSRWLDGVRQWTSEENVITPFGWPGAWSADASRIEGRFGGGLHRVLPSGTEAWRVESRYGPIAGPHAINLDVDGVVYVDTGSRIIAFQTDMLPPSEPGCWDVGCNRRRNNWAGSP
jgi:hypothetical protein